LAGLSACVAKAGRHRNGYRPRQEGSRTAIAGTVRERPNLSGHIGTRGRHRCCSPRRQVEPNCTRSARSLIE
jgi:hypothetical protein